MKAEERPVKPPPVVGGVATNRGVVVGSGVLELFAARVEGAARGPEPCAAGLAAGGGGLLRQRDPQPERFRPRAFGGRGVVAAQDVPGLLVERIRLGVVP